MLTHKWDSLPPPIPCLARVDCRWLPAFFISEGLWLVVFLPSPQYLCLLRLVWNGEYGGRGKERGKTKFLLDLHLLLLTWLKFFFFFLSLNGLFRTSPARFLQLSWLFAGYSWFPLLYLGSSYSWASSGPDKLPTGVGFFVKCPRSTFLQWSAYISQNSQHLCPAVRGIHYLPVVTQADIASSGSARH